MANYFAEVTWRREGEDFLANEYSRAHEWQFDGGLKVAASASPHIVPLPFSVEQNVDPEEAFVASLSSCHMLFFLSIAAKQKFQVESYIDKAEGIMSQNAQGKQAMTRVFLRPTIVFSGERVPDTQRIEKIHHLAHDNCFIANSVNTEIVIESS